MADKRPRLIREIRSRRLLLSDPGGWSIIWDIQKHCLDLVNLAVLDLEQLADHESRIWRIIEICMQL